MHDRQAGAASELPGERRLAGAARSEDGNPLHGTHFVHRSTFLCAMQEVRFGQRDRFAEPVAAERLPWPPAGLGSRSRPGPYRPAGSGGISGFRPIGGRRTIGACLDNIQFSS